MRFKKNHVCFFNGLEVNIVACRIHNGSQYPEQPCLNKNEYSCLLFENWLLCGSSANVTCTFLASETMDKLSEFNISVSLIF